MTEFFALRPKTYSYLMYDGIEKTNKLKEQRNVWQNEYLSLMIIKIVY